MFLNFKKSKPVWIRAWHWRWPTVLKDFSQSLHLYGFSPKYSMKCLNKISFYVWQQFSKTINKTSFTPTLRPKMSKFSATIGINLLNSVPCVFILVAVLNILILIYITQILKSNPPVWQRMWILRSLGLMNFLSQTLHLQTFSSRTLELGKLYQATKLIIWVFVRAK